MGLILFCTMMALMIGVLIGVAVGRALTKIDGLFIVDDEDPNVTRWVLDMHIDSDKIPKKKTVHLKVCQMENGDV